MHMDELLNSRKLSDNALVESNGIKIGVFGSNTKRAKDSWLNVVHSNPGPGTYDTQSVMNKPDISLTVTGRK